MTDSEPNVEGLAVVVVEEEVEEEEEDTELFRLEEPVETIVGEASVKKLEEGGEHVDSKTGTFGRAIWSVENEKFGLIPE